MMRGTPGMRLTFAILSPAFLLLCVVAIRSEETRPWMHYQEEFNRLYVARASAELKKVEAGDDAAERARWQRLVDEASQARTEINQIFLEDLEVVDRCVTCHRGITNPLFHDAPQPFRSHPGDLLNHHDPNAFGCTPCHGGEGAATSDAAHGRDGSAATPMLPAVQVQSRCGHCHEVFHGVAGAEALSRGADSFMEKGCYGCHDVRGRMPHLPKFGPPLTPIKSKLEDAPSWIYNWIKAPQHLAVETAMPDFQLRDEEVGKITAFLLSLPEPAPSSPVALEGASAQEGKRLFEERGCRGCHAVAADERSVTARVPHLAGIGSKVTARWLDRWLADPKAYNPDTAMPKLELTDAERHAVVAYLLTLQRTDPLPVPPDLSRFAVEEGKQLVRRYECYGCHAIEGFERQRPSVPDLAEFSRKPVDELDFGSTTGVARTKWDWLAHKLRQPRAYETEKIELLMPTAKLSDEEIQSIVTYVLGADTPSIPDRYAVRASTAQSTLPNLSWMLAHLNCNGCHRLDEREPHIAKWLERKTMTPPTLHRVGARLQGQYLYQFLLEPKAVRPWLKMRMPNFGLTEAQAQALVDGFSAAARTTNPYTYVAKERVVSEQFERGVRRFQHYKCVQCHPTSIDEGLSPDVDPDDLSINLMLSKTRLRPDWIKDFMARPKEIAGQDTRMPTVFFTVDGVPKVEHPQEDIEVITAYLMAMEEPPEVTLQATGQVETAPESAPEPTDWTQYDY
jgi:mono/diheme cytochrome c family protein